MERGASTGENQRKISERFVEFHCGLKVFFTVAMFNNNCSFKSLIMVGTTFYAALNEFEALMC